MKKPVVLVIMDGVGLGDGGPGVVINVYASPGMDVNALADKIQARFSAMNNQRRLAGA